MTTPTYRVLVDWDSDGGLLLGDFEVDLEGWDGTATPGLDPAVALSTVRAYHGATSMRVTWSSASAIQIVEPDPITGLIVGRDYTLSAWVYVPSSGGQQVRCAVSGLSSGTASSTTNTWVKITYTFTATATTHLVRVQTSAVPTAGNQTWVDYVQLIGDGEDITAAPPGVLGEVDMRYGRDKARSLSETSPGRLDFDVDNVSRDLSPENASSPLHGLLGPGREVVVEATYQGALQRLYCGFLDDYQVDSSAGTWLASFSALDGLARFKDVPVSTAVYPALRTGEAIDILLDAIGWTGARDLDPGATTLRWWCADSDDAYAELMDVVAAEGPSALVFCGANGEFVFRDRHHRLIRTRSITSQATFVDGVAGIGEVEHDPPFEIDFGFKDVVNKVELQVSDRAPSDRPEVVWEDGNAYTLDDGETRSIDIVAENDPFYGLISPTFGAPTETAPEPDADGIPKSPPDFVIQGGTVEVMFNRTSGKTVTMLVTAVGVVDVLSMTLRGYPIKSTARETIKREDTASIARHRGQQPYKETSPWLNAHDAAAVADLVLGQRADRLPVVTFKVSNGTAAQLQQQLGRDLSDRITVEDSESGFNGECYLESIQHVIDDDGNTLTTTFSAEKIPVLPDNLFTFNVAGAGFNDGVFAPSGIDDPTKIFRFDVVNQGFDKGLFAY